MKSTFKQLFADCALSCLLPSALFFLLCPFALFIGNKNEFVFSITDILPQLILAAAICFAVLMLICSLVRNEKARSILTAIIVGIGIGFFLQSNLMAGPYGSLNGAAIDWGSMDRWGVLTSGVWVLCVAVPAALVLLLKNRRILNLIAGVVLALQVLTCVVLIAIGGTEDIIKTDDFSITNEEAFTLSDKQNVVVFLTDNFSSALLEEIITEDTAYNEQFDGFTYFPDTSGGGCTTKGGLPFILTGMWNDNSLPYKDYLKQGYENNKLYSTLEELGYDSRLFVEKQYVDSSAAAIFENMEYEKTIVNEPMVMQLMYKLTAFTCFPHYMKEFFWMYTGEFAEATISEEDSTHLTPDTAFYSSLMSIGLSTNSDYTGAYRFYYLNGPHAPYTMDENAKYSDSATEMQQAKGSLKIVSDYIQQLKDLGLYDNTMIVVLADHGDWESEELFNPMLMVKPFASETDGITVSEAPISYVDLMPTFMEALTGEDCGTTVFEIPKDQPRERRFLYYEWAGDWSSSYMPQMYEFSITGNVRDISSRTPTGMVYSPGGKVTDAREYHLGQLIPYMEDEPGYPTYVRYGLLFAESSMTWTRGSYTHWSFPMADYTSGDLVFTLDLLLVRYDKQQVDLYVNDTYVESRTVTTSGKLEFTIPAKLISDSTLEIRLEYPDVASQEQDVRGLGIRTVVLNTPGGEVIPYESTQDDGFSLTHIIGIPLTALLNACNRVLNNYVLAIFVFTFLTKVILLPVSLWTNKNGIIMIKMMPELNRLKVKYYGDKETISDKTQELYKQEHYNPIASSLPMIIQVVLLMGVIDAVKQMLGSDTGSILNAVPTQAGGMTWLMPVLAALAALALGIGQNLLNPLQKEQTKKDQWFTNGISIAISLFLGAFVSVGTCVYWIASNLFTIPFQWLMNKIMPPEKYVDYEALEESRKDLAVLDSLKEEVSKEDKKRERADYKRFFSVANKHLVFYSEKSGFYKYFQNTIAYLLEHSNVIIHYVTNDPKDQIFEIAKSEPRIRPYYIGQQKIITLMMKMDADMVITTTHELDTYYLKRSYIRKDIEYIYIPHAMVSTNMTSNKGCVDNYDTVFCVGKHQLEELREAEAMYGTPVKNLIPVGYGMLDNMLEAYAKMEKDVHAKKRILVAPSWQEDNLLDSCIDALVEQLYDPNHFVVVRPHPEYVKRYPGKVKALQDKFKDLDPELFLFETDFSSNVSIYTADMLITDWSGIVQEFCYTTKKPGLMINTPMKVMNPEYTRYKNPPLDISMRNILGKTLEMDELNKTRETVEELFSSAAFYQQQITDMTNEYVYNIGNSGSVGARYIIRRLMEKDAEREANKK